MNSHVIDADIFGESDPPVPTRLRQALALAEEQQQLQTWPRAYAGDDDAEAARLLLEAARKPVTDALQFDGHRATAPDPIIHPDADGDCLTAGRTQELLFNLGPDMPVRLMIHPGTPTEDVLRLVDKILRWIERSGGVTGMFERDEVSLRNVEEP